MFIKAVKYTLKVWLTSVLGAPFIFIIITLYMQGNSWSPAESGSLAPVEMYILYTLFQAVFSFPTWSVFLLLTYGALAVIRPFSAAVITIILAGIALTILTFMALYLTDDLYILMICNASVIGCGAWFYRPSLPESIPNVNDL
jgi:hypothetical protein